MIIKEYLAAEPSGGRTRLFVDLTCDHCGNEKFFYQKRWLTSDKWYCSPKCKNIANGVTKELKCDHCEKLFYRAINKLKNSKSGKYFCSRQCKDAAQKYMKEIQPPHYTEQRKDYRNTAFNVYPKKCNRCGYDNILALEVHHIDRNRDNNDVSNLEILCANCHRIEHK